MRRTKEGLSIKVGYSKTGGRAKESYQAYVLAFSEKNFTKIEKLTPQQAIENGLATIVHTQIAAFTAAPDAPPAIQQVDESGEYRLAYELNTEQFVEKMIAAKQIEKTSDIGGWQRFDDKLRLAIFIPFLDDKKYSVLDGLPNDKHECNYSGESALLFQKLTPKLTISFGVVRASKLKDGEHFIELNGTHGIKADAE